ncbi:hypothetical protein ACFVXC_17885 [Streptomyces sp. NPDC058257]|uniref:hypothetical protein n=1 Tax=Streptomyces sp. NPDC058257 TaxID=3346409 RepID=UPI0036E34F40
MLSMALHLRDKEMSLRDIAKRLVITTGTKKNQHPPSRHRHADAAGTRRTGRHGGGRVITRLGQGPRCGEAELPVDRERGLTVEHCAGRHRGLSGDCTAIHALMAVRPDRVWHRVWPQSST